MIDRLGGGSRRSFLTGPAEEVGPAEAELDRLPGDEGDIPTVDAKVVEFAVGQAAPARSRSRGIAAPVGDSCGTQVSFFFCSFIAFVSVL